MLGKRTWLFDSIAPQIISTAGKHPRNWVVRDVGTPNQVRFEALHPTLGHWDRWESIQETLPTQFRWVDAAGNTSEVVTSDIISAELGSVPTDSENDGGSTGCASGTGAAEILSILAFGLWGRRRKRSHLG